MLPDCDSWHVNCRHVDFLHADRNLLIAGFVPHAVNNLTGFPNAFTDATIQAFMMILIAVACNRVWPRDCEAGGQGVRGSLKPQTLSE
jgi:hypothetical protein